MSVKFLLVGERLRYRSFNGANKALPVLASCLTRNGFKNVVQIDLERPDVTAYDLLREVQDADIVAFAGAMTPQWPELDVTVRMVADHLQRLSRSHVPIVVGGYATKGVEDIARLSPWISGYFDGEGEAGIIEIAKSVARGTFFEDRPRLRGICYIDAGGRFRRSIAERTTDLDCFDQNFGFVHVPERHNMDIFRVDGRQAKTAQIFTQRGCPYACAFCNKSEEGNNVVWVSDEALRAQLRRLKDEGYSAVYLDVDTFSISERRARKQAEILHEEGFIWGSNTRIDRIDPDLMHHFVQHGCRYMFCGVEHVHPGVALAIDKFNGSLAQKLARAHTYLDQVRSVYRSMTATGLPSSLFLILGLPKAILNEDRTEVIGYAPTTFEDDAEAIRFGLEECDPDFLNFNMLRFMPGSLAADMPNHPAYTCVRPTGEAPITGGHFLPRVSSTMNYSLPEYHGIFRICESVGESQPRTTAVDADRVYRTVEYSIRLINEKIRRGGKKTSMFIDKDIVENKLIQQDDDGSYRLAPLKAFEILTAN